MGEETCCGSNTTWDPLEGRCVAEVAVTQDCGQKGKVKKGKVEESLMMFTACDCHQHCTTVEGVHGWSYAARRNLGGVCDCLSGEKMTIQRGKGSTVSGFL